MTAFHNVGEWIEENKQYFLPPVCNKMMHSEGQMKLFFVGGPNQRKDYHIECGEELFYQLKGDMVLKVVERGVHRDVRIREGDIFLLPGRVQHSPQRWENTVGLVIERERADTEKDGLRYFIEKDGVPTTESLYERWFKCEDLGPQLAAIIKEYFTTEQFKTGKPVPGTIPDKRPLELDMQIKLQDPFNFLDYVEKHKKEIESSKDGFLMFPDAAQSKVVLYGPGQYHKETSSTEFWIWQFEGSGSATIDSQDCKPLKKNDSLLLPKNSKFTLHQDANSWCLTYYQIPNSPYYTE